MARIRQLKPEFWSSPSTAQASPLARLLYMAMWNWADDSGHGTANPKELEGFAFPNDDVVELSHGTSENFRALMAEVSDAYGVIYYRVRNRLYFEIPSWKDHQRNERLAKGKFPLPQEGEVDTIWGLTSGDAKKRGTSDTESRKLRTVRPEQPTTSVAVSEDHRVIVTGEQGRPKLRNQVTTEEKMNDPVNVTHRVVQRWEDKHEAAGRPMPKPLANDVRVQVQPLAQQGYSEDQLDAAINAWDDSPYDSPKQISAVLARMLKGPGTFAPVIRPATITQPTGDTRALQIAAIQFEEDDGPPMLERIPYDDNEPDHELTSYPEWTNQP